jgi:phosphohistidine phosphatase
MTGHTLVLLRHAKSDWDGEEPDVERPLAPRGRREAPEAGRWLAANLPVLELAVVSPAVRAQQTWQLVLAELAEPPPARTDERIYAASRQTLLDVVRELPEETAAALVVGHNPGLEELVRVLTGELVPMPTSAVAVIDVPGSWSATGRTAAVLRAAGRPPTMR